jgi:hypothetical protein
VNDNELWIHQESAVISAESHDVWRFTPDFLVASEIVPDAWPCRQATQSPDRVTIQFGLTRWVMTPNELWITVYPDRRLKDEGAAADRDLIPTLTSNFLEAMPYLPTRRLWLFWQISAVNPDRDRWMLENFLSKSWPIELGTVALQPQLTVFLDDLAIQVSIRNGTFPRRGEAHEESTAFDCFVSRGLDQTHEEMVLDVNHRTERLLLVERTIQHLLGNGS